ncbi:MAG: hypothetical protein GY842_07805 [bacterium]|nr:hypothetical protein [bacterium]
MKRARLFASGCPALVWVCLGLGMVYRMALALRAPVGYDEVFVMGVGLDELTASARAFLVDVPLARSNASTPLWWWIQALPPLLAGRLSLWGLRLVPVVLGLSAILVGFVAARSRFGRGTATILVVFLSFSDVLAFTNGRGEFSESLLLAILLPSLCLIGLPRRTMAKGGLAWLLLMTHLGKGLFLVGGLVLADIVALSLYRRNVRAAVGSIAAAAGAVAGVCVWLGVVHLFSADGPLATDIGSVSGVGDALWKLTAGYAQTKQHMVAGTLDAAQVWLDGWVWPLTAITAVPLLVGAVAGTRRFRGRRGAVCLGLACWVVVGLLVVIPRGLLGARFHILYLPPLWLLASIGLWRLRRASPAFLLLLGVAWAMWVWGAFSWTGWEDRTWRLSASGLGPAGLCLAIAGAFAMGRGWSAQRAVWAGRVCVVLGATLLVTAVITRGPMQWVRFARLEPYAQSTELAGIDSFRSGRGELPEPSRRTLYIDLAHYYLSKDERVAEDLHRAVSYARRETELVPHDARAWFYLGDALHHAGAPVDQIRAAWERSRQLDSTPLVQERLRELRLGEGHPGG